MKISDLKIDKNWTLFLDRDGVINVRLLDDYVKNWDEFIFIEGVLEAIKGFSQIFNYIFIVTNQQGIGKKIMTIDDFNFINNKMLKTISQYGGKIDKVFFCPHLKEQNCICRKPKTGMITDAKREFPDIDLTKSILAGDTSSDIQMGKNAGLFTALISKEDTNLNYDFRYDSLYDFYCDIIKDFS